MPFFTEQEVRARGRQYIAQLANIRRLARAVVADFRGLNVTEPGEQDGPDNTTAVIQVNKPYKPRKLKMDQNHLQTRKKMKKVRKQPKWKQRNKVIRKKYMQKFGKQLKKRTQKVNQIRDARGLN